MSPTCRARFFQDDSEEREEDDADEGAQEEPHSRARRGMAEDLFGLDPTLVVLLDDDRFLDLDRAVPAPLTRFDAAVAVPEMTVDGLFANYVRLSRW